MLRRQGSEPLPAAPGLKEEDGVVKQKVKWGWLLSWGGSPPGPCTWMLCRAPHVPASFNKGVLRVPLSPFWRPDQL